MSEDWTPENMEPTEDSDLSNCLYLQISTQLTFWKGMLQPLFSDPLHTFICLPHLPGVLICNVSGLFLALYSTFPLLQPAEENTI